MDILKLFRHKAASPEAVDVNGLTVRETAIIKLVAEGKRNREIATMLGTSEEIIKTRLQNIYAKFGVSDRLELALYAIHHRLIQV